VGVACQSAAVPAMTPLMSQATGLKRRPAPAGGGGHAFSADSRMLAWTCAAAPSSLMPMATEGNSAFRWLMIERRTNGDARASDPAAMDGGY